MKVLPYTRQFIYNTYKSVTRGLLVLKKYSKRIEMKTFMKILLFSYENGPQKKTNMATNCKMSYTRFKPILLWMVEFGFLKIYANPTEIITITEQGKEILQKIQNNPDMNY